MPCQPLPGGSHGARPGDYTVHQGNAKGARHILARDQRRRPRASERGGVSNLCTRTAGDNLGGICAEKSFRKHAITCFVLAWPCKSNLPTYLCKYTRQECSCVPFRGVLQPACCVFAVNLFFVSFSSSFLGTGSIGCCACWRRRIGIPLPSTALQVCVGVHSVAGCATCLRCPSRVW